MSGRKKHRTADEFLQYLGGKLSSRERHSFERDTEADPFEKEALEGLERLTPGEAETDILALHARLRKRVARRRRFAIYSVAATVASILIVGTVFLQIHDFNPVAEDETVDKSELPSLSPEKQEVEESIAETGNLPEKEHRSRTVDTPAEEGERKAEGPSSKKGSEMTPPQPSKEVTAEAADEIPVISEEAAYEMEEAETVTAAGEIIAEDIVSVEAEPVQETQASVPKEKSAAPPMMKRQMEVPADRLEKDLSGEVSGVVISAEDMEPLPEAMVMVKGGDTRVVADMQGRFSLPAEENTGTTLIASFVGMETREFPVSEGSEVELVMQPDISTMDEVVMVVHPDGSASGSKGAPSGEYTAGLPYNESRTPAQPSVGYRVYEQYVEQNIRFPDDDTSTERGIVVLKFIVTPEGKIREINPLRSPGPDFTREAIRVISKGPAWNPATDSSGNIEEVVRLRIVFKR